MNTIETLRELLGWCSVISIGVLLFSTIMVLLLHSVATRIHSKLFKLDAKDIHRAYFKYLGQLKIAIIVLNIVPYFALVIMS